MTLRSESEPLKAVLVRLFASDVARLKEMYPSRHTTFLRYLLRNHLLRMDASITKSLDDLEEEEVEVEGLK